MTLQDISKLKKQALSDISTASSSVEIETLRVKYLGRQAKLTLFLRTLKDLPTKDKQTLGKTANEARLEIETALIASRASHSKPTKHSTRVDVTAPGHRVARGHLHPLTKLRR